MNASKNDCFDAVTVSYIKNEQCQLCETDGCNSAAQFAPFALFIAISMVVSY